MFDGIDSGLCLIMVSLYLSYSYNCLPMTMSLCTAQRRHGPWMPSSTSARLQQHSLSTHPLATPSCSGATARFHVGFVHRKMNSIWAAHLSSSSPRSRASGSESFIRISLVPSCWCSVNRTWSCPCDAAWRSGPRPSLHRWVARRCSPHVSGGDRRIAHHLCGLRLVAIYRGCSWS